MLALTMLALFFLSPSRSRAEVVYLPELEQRALVGRELLEIDAARVRGAAADAKKAEASRRPRFALKAESTLAPGRQLVQVFDTSAVDSEGRVNRNASPYLVQATPSIKQGSDAFELQLRNGLELSGQASLYDFGRSKAAIQAGRASEAAAKAGGAVTTSAIVRVVRVRYLSWLSAHQLARLAEQAAQEAAQRRERVASLIKEGVRPEGDLTPARADELLTKLELERAFGELQSARLALEHAVGSELSTTAEPDLALLEVDDAPITPREDPEARALATQHSAALSLVRMHDKENAPDLSAAVSAGVSNQDRNVFPLYGAALKLSVPLWDGGISNANVQAARARAAEIDARRRAHDREREQGVAQAALDAHNALSRLSTAEELIEVGSQRLEEAEEGYELGATGIDAISQARNLLRRAQTELLLAKVAHREARLRITE
jgi:outer membrane protein TolC